MTDFKSRSEEQMIEYARRMRKRAEDADTELERVKLYVGQAVAFLDRRRDEGIEFPYESRPLRKLREIAS